jgi:hypothetical protein
MPISQPSPKTFEMPKPATPPEIIEPMDPEEPIIPVEEPAIIPEETPVIIPEEAPYENPPKEMPPPTESVV